MQNIPYTFGFSSPGFVPEHYDNHIKRYLSAMKGQYLNQEAYQAMLDDNDTLLYEVYELTRPQVAGELLHGITVVHPGKVGNEYFMTRGHFHTVLETGEIYYCLQGHGVMVMETPEGDWAVEAFVPGKVMYVLPRWAHRSVNTGSDEDLVTFFVCPGNSGHDYETIEQQGFRKRVVDADGKALVMDNPRWRPSQA